MIFASLSLLSHSSIFLTKLSVGREESLFCIFFLIAIKIRTRSVI